MKKFLIFLFLISFVYLKAQQDTCTFSVPYSVVEPECQSKGSITIDISNITGGTSPYQIAFNNDSIFTSNGIYDSLEAGNYTFIIKDNATCFDTIIINLNSPPLPVTDAEVTNITCENENGSIKINEPKQGTPPFNYTLNGSSSNDGNFSSLKAGSYLVTVTDSAGCEYSFELTLLDECQPLIYPAELFTPNNDGFNDTWQIKGIEAFSKAEVFVFTRWGQRIYHKKSYNNQNAWDGRYLGSKLPAATYYYIIDLHLDNKKDKRGVVKGAITLMY